MVGMHGRGKLLNLWQIESSREERRGQEHTYPCHRISSANYMHCSSHGGILLHCVSIQYFLYLFMGSGWFIVLVIVNNAIINMYVLTSFFFFWCVLRNNIAGLHSSFILSIWSNFYTVFHNCWAELHSHPQCSFH